MLPQYCGDLVEKVSKRWVIPISFHKKNCDRILQTNKNFDIFFFNEIRDVEKMPIMKIFLKDLQIKSNFKD